MRGRAVDLTECPSQSVQFLGALAIVIHAGLSQPLERSLGYPEDRLRHPRKVGDLETVAITIDTRLEFIRVTEIPILS